MEHPQAPDALKRCRHCGADNDPGFAFCLTCGSPLSPAPDPYSLRSPPLHASGDTNFGHAAPRPHAAPSLPPAGHAAPGHAFRDTHAMSLAGLFEMARPLLFFLLLAVIGLLLYLLFR